LAWGVSPFPTVLPAHSRAPRLTLSRVQVARGAHQERGHRHQQRRGSRPPPTPGAHGCWSAGSQRIRARGAGPRGSCFEAAFGEALGDCVSFSSPLAARWPEPPRQGPWTRPRGGRAASAVTKAVARGPAEAAPTLRPLRPGPRPVIPEPDAPRCAPCLLLLGLARSGPRSADSGAEGRADRRAGT
jgi:hypothetical protein